MVISAELFSRKSFGGSNARLHSTAKEGSRWHSGDVPKGYGMVTLPQLSSQLGFVIGKVCDGTDTDTNTSTKTSVNMTGV